MSSRIQVQSPVAGAATRPVPIRTDGAPESFWVSMRYFAISRIVVAALLVTIVPLQIGTIDGIIDRKLFVLVAGVYLVLGAVYLAALNWGRPYFTSQLIVHTLTDLVAMALLTHAAGGTGSGFGVLLIAPIAAAAVVGTPLLTAFFAAVATLLLIGDTIWRGLAFGLDSVALFQAALTGAAGFVAGAVVNWVAGRLHVQEQLASRRGRDLRNQLAVTQLVISELSEGVLVVDRAGRLKTSNPAARTLLGVESEGVAAPIEPEGARWQAITAALAQWSQGPAPRPDSVELTLPAESTGGDPPRVRLRFLASLLDADDDMVIMVEDQRRLEDRAQQLKLASMGRLSASIAHEIRNPLGAIRHANSLLAEQLHEPPLERLARIVEQNSLRINRVIEDVLSIARRERATLEQIDIQAFLHSLLPEFIAQVGADARRISVRPSSGARLRFDSNHLRQVLVNLLTNALRYASTRPEAVVIEWRQLAGDQLELRIADDGPGLAPETIQHVFEPFFTTEARGTGLGLYLARELCHANGAALRYEPAPAAGRYHGAFVVTTAR